ncbi:MAG TPA: type IX secretion system membrane protein PorP/SprF [Candidatus Gastranaerophilales bacterium]|nr:type IX secretion system membrane protein PorP/SprF [Candidatus Gastranaerophilales bacterium]
MKIPPLKIVITALLLLIAFAGSLHAQQLSILNTTTSNAYGFNPAMAGSENVTNLMLHYRKQWAQMPGSPENQLFTADGKTIIDITEKFKK